jgi:hypothetical protein
MGGGKTERGIPHFADFVRNDEAGGARVKKKESGRV